MKQLCARMGAIGLLTLLAVMGPDTSVAVAQSPGLPANSPIYEMTSPGACVVGKRGSQTIQGTRYLLTNGRISRTVCSQTPLQLCDVVLGTTAPADKACPVGSRTPAMVEQAAADQQLKTLREAIARARAASPTTRPIAGITIVEQLGPVWLVLPGGERVRIEKGVGISFSSEGGAKSVGSVPEGTRLQTGPDGALNLLLADNTTFAMSQGADLRLDRFLYGPEFSLAVRLMHGLFEYTSGLLGKNTPDAVTIDGPVGCICIRGTRLEARINPDQSGHVKMFEGEMELRPKSGGAPVRVVAGQMITFDRNGKISAPKPNTN